MTKKHELFAPTLALLVGFSAIAAGNHVQAGAISLYGVEKSQNYVQSSDSSVNPDSASAFAFKAIGVTSDPSAAGFLTVAGSMIPDVLSANGNLLLFEQDYSSSGALDAGFPAGAYNLEFFSSAGLEGPATLTLGAASYPSVTPLISNFTAAQSIDSTKDFVLNWNSFTGASANDFVQLTVTDSSGNVLFQTGFPGQANALAGSALSATIPANTLQSAGNTAVVSFNHVASLDTTSLAGATGATIFTKATSLSLTPAGSGSGGGGANPPVLLSSNPSNLAMNVATNSPVIFKFSKAMAADSSITWSFANVDQSKFGYSWSADQLSLTCVYAGGFPPGTPVAWELDPTGFKDTSGTALSDTPNLSGVFFTKAGSSTGGGGTTNAPCGNTGSTNSNFGSFFVSKSFNYIQTDSGAPTLNPDSGPTFEAFARGASNNPISQATLTLPNGTSRTLTNLFGILLFSEEFSTEADLEAAYPPGTYTVHMQGSGGAATASLVLPAASAYPPTPQLSNLAALSSFNPAADFTFQWSPFTGASGNDSIYFEVHDQVGTSFSAPDPCIPRTLANTATSIVVPKNTFGGSAIEGGSLNFDKFLILDTNSVPNFAVGAYVTKDTEFKTGSSTGGGGGQPPQLLNLSRMANGSVQFQVQATVGVNLVVEAKNNLQDATWQTIPTGAVDASGLLQVTDPGAVGQPHRFYRARLP
jgi:hypothetical protein